jgi:protein-S-isoprenylcysteine O-methyltransferase Ste14
MDGHADAAPPLQLLLRVPVPWIFVLAYLVGVGLQFFFPITVSSPDTRRICLFAGIALFATGAGFASWSLLIFHRARNTTTPGERSVKLVTWGPYRLSRNPMYISLILAYLGEAGILVQLWPLPVLPLVVIYVDRTVIPLEEARLSEVFGERYEQYRTRVSRWI